MALVTIPGVGVFDRDDSKEVVVYTVVTSLPPQSWSKTIRTTIARVLRSWAGALEGAAA